MTTVTVSLLLIILVLAPEHNARPQNVNISQSGNIRISTVNGVIECDEMICPSNSVGCSVSMQTTDDLANIETIRKCYDSEKTTTKEEKSTTPNPYPGTEVSSYSDSSSTGVTQHFHYGNKGEVEYEISSKLEAINKQFEEWQQKFQQEMDTFNMNFQKQILNFKNTVPK